MTRYGLRFTYNNGTTSDQFYSSSRKRDRIEKAWANEKAAGGYSNTKVKSVTKIEKDN